jgi:hypothetical protein
MKKKDAVTQMLQECPRGQGGTFFMVPGGSPLCSIRINRFHQHHNGNNCMPVAENCKRAL